MIFRDFKGFERDLKGFERTWINLKGFDTHTFRLFDIRCLFHLIQTSDMPKMLVLKHNIPPILCIKDQEVFYVIVKKVVWVKVWDGGLSKYCIIFLYCLFSMSEKQIYEVNPHKQIERFLPFFVCGGVTVENQQ